MTAEPPPYDVQFRQLTPADVQPLKDLLGVFGEAFEEVDTYQAKVPSDAYLTKLLGKNHFIAVVAFSDGSVVGGLTAYELEKFEQERSEIYIYDLAVSRPHRRRGIETLLIGELGRVAASRGAWVIYVQADLVDDPAIALYGKLGSRETVHHFDIPVPKEA